VSAFPFDTVLVANRGEIAARILRTVKRLGLRGAVLHHPADTTAPALALADIVIGIEGATPVAAFLDGAQIVAKAVAAGVGAVHPGYGFLSENAGFCRAVMQAGMVFVGPSSDAIELMGDKVRARAFVAARGFPVAPSAIEDDDPASFAARARALDVPLLIKPAAGGGGKGMRIVRDLAGWMRSWRRRGAKGCGILAMGACMWNAMWSGHGISRCRCWVTITAPCCICMSGNVRCNGGFRRCWRKRPRQGCLRRSGKTICETAAGIARAAGYRNAGTVEFIYGGGAFYFLEMNTRLQVEHPVTEAVTGLDLVEQQLRVAAGERLGFAQEDVNLHGHAIELRIYAEDSDRDFAPCTGPVLLWRPPAGAGVRIDAGISQGDVVTAGFDPMLAKLVVHGKDRAEALARADQALRNTVLLGCGANVGFLRRLIGLPEVRDGALHTGLIGEHIEALRTPPPTDAALRAVAAVAALSSRAVRDAADAVPALHAAMGEWRN
jgi:acetyl-CoA/propionyl-CoA carboxylase biotin carboxyl carrier protein